MNSDKLHARHAQQVVTVQRFQLILSSVLKDFIVLLEQASHLSVQKVHSDRSLDSKHKLNVRNVQRELTVLSKVSLRRMAFATLVSIVEVEPKFLTPWMEQLVMFAMLEVFASMVPNRSLLAHQALTILIRREKTGRTV